MPRSAKKLALGRIVQALLALAGFGTFAMLVRKVEFGQIISAPSGSFPLLVLAIIALAFINYSFDTLSWWLVAGEQRPSFWRLMSIRARAEALTNTLPGGALIGEPMKVMLLLESSTMSRAEATTSFLLSKFSIIVGQICYVVLGVALSFTIINNASHSAFGTGHAGWLVLGVSITMLALMIALLAAMVWMQPLMRWLLPTVPTTKWRRRWNLFVAEAHAIEALIARAARRGGGALMLSLLCAFIAWALNAVEAYLIVRWLGIDGTFMQLYAIDSVSCVIRMVLFVLPIGLGGQDWTITGLMMAHGFSDPVGASASLVTLKRGREFLVIAIGLILLLVMPRRAQVVQQSPADLQVEEEGLETESIAAQR
jgi:uncharacterized membrane protein YbhN (UPF0104 family)